ncbi:MAG: transglutaminase family protein, partial [Gammaproteobacteria bacterium]|nr:transglutaminase family protein [Gammaproteobacteria bacterium]
MLASRKALVFSMVLILVSLTSMSLRYLFNDPEIVPAGDSVWELHWEFMLTDTVPEAMIHLATPIDTQYTQVFEQNISLEGMRIRRSRLSKDGTREIIARAIQDKEVSIGVDFAMRVSPSGIPQFISQRDILDSTRRQLYLSVNEQLPINNEYLQELLNSLVSEVPEQELIFNILFDFCMNKIKADQQSSDDVQSILHNKKASVLGKVRLLATLSRAAKIPTRIVMGIILDEENEVLPHYWIETNTNGKWLSFDPTEGFIQDMPSNYIPIRKNGESIIVFSEPTQLKQMILEVNKRDVVSGFFAEAEQSLSDILDLNRLSLSTRLTLSFLL